MSVQELEFRISTEVSPLTEEYEEYTPAAGSSITISDFVAEAAYHSSARVSVIWDYGGDNEEYLWSIMGSGKLPRRINLTGVQTDGIKKLALVVDNGTLNSMIISGWMSILVSTNE